ncbi:hypothetical protein EDB83DRAFT_2639766 [Lactarius deliciosus]|nr:hypothetical protein EDB83DRAFT_2639766 [Lactarius deliciosus]
MHLPCQTERGGVAKVIDRTNHRRCDKDRVATETCSMKRRDEAWGLRHVAHEWGQVATVEVQGCVSGLSQPVTMGQVTIARGQCCSWLASTRLGALPNAGAVQIQASIVCCSTGKVVDTREVSYACEYGFKKKTKSRSFVDWSECGKLRLFVDRPTLASRSLPPLHHTAFISHPVLAALELEPAFEMVKPWRCALTQATTMWTSTPRPQPRGPPWYSTPLQSGQPWRLPSDGDHYLNRYINHDHRHNRSHFTQTDWRAPATPGSLQIMKRVLVHPFKLITLHSHRLQATAPHAPSHPIAAVNHHTLMTKTATQPWGCALTQVEETMIVKIATVAKTTERRQRRDDDEH